VNTALAIILVIGGLFAVIGALIKKNSEHKTEAAVAKMSLSKMAANIALETNAREKLHNDETDSSTDARIARAAELRDRQRT
jgi:hypothetical protein